MSLYLSSVLMMIIVQMMWNLWVTHIASERGPASVVYGHHPFQEVNTSSMVIWLVLHSHVIFDIQNLH